MTVTDRAARRRERLGRSLWRAAVVPLAVAGAMTGAVACGASGPADTSTPTSTGAPASITTSTPAAATVVGFSDVDNGRTVTVSAGQRLTVILHSADFVFVSPSDPAVVGADGQPTVNPGSPSCVAVAGTGCGTVVTSFLALTAGEAELRADRPRCFEPDCPAADAHWRLMVRVEGGGIATTTVAEVPTTTVADAPSPDGEVRGTVLFSPVCPVEQLPPDPACAPRPGPADIELVLADGSVAVAGRAGNDGAFILVAGAGSYTVRASVPDVSLGGGCQVDPAELTLEEGSSVVVTVSCDTGIR